MLLWLPLLLLLLLLLPVASHATPSPSAAPTQYEPQNYLLLTSGTNQTIASNTAVTTFWTGAPTSQYQSLGTALVDPSPGEIVSSSGGVLLTVGGFYATPVAGGSSTEVIITSNGVTIATDGAVPVAPFARTFAAITPASAPTTTLAMDASAGTSFVMDATYASRWGAVLFSSRTPFCIFSSNTLGFQPTVPANTATELTTYFAFQAAQLGNGLLVATSPGRIFVTRSVSLFVTWNVPVDTEPLPFTPATWTSLASWIAINGSGVFGYTNYAFPGTNVSISQYSSSAIVSVPAGSYISVWVLPTGGLATLDQLGSGFFSAVVLNGPSCGLTLGDSPPVTLPNGVNTEIRNSAQATACPSPTYVVFNTSSFGTTILPMTQAQVFRKTRRRISSARLRVARPSTPGAP